MTSGAALTYATISAAWILYLTALAAWLAVRPRIARLAWIVGCLFYLGHVVAAFAFHYGWSHQAAYRETARQTAELFGFVYGGGIYFNYVFTLIWLADAVWIWFSPESYRRRPRWISIAVHAYLAFLYFNATVVFGGGWIRWSGVAATISLSVWWLRQRGREN
jgi:hypothetical protein